MLCALVVCVVATAIAAPPDRVDGLTAILAVASVIAGLMAAGAKDGLSLSSSFLVFALAAVFLGPRSAVVAAVTSEVVSALLLRTRVRAVVLNNFPAGILPAIAAGLASRAIVSHPSDSATFYIAVAVASLGAIPLSFVIFASLRRVFLPTLDQFGIRTFLEDLPSTTLNVLLVVAGAGITVKVGKAGIAFALSGVFTFSYMAHLVAQSRQRAQQYVSLSWGVLAGLMRSLDIRDQRAGRHAAAVARFARDMAEAVGMSEQEQELAHLGPAARHRQLRAVRPSCRARPRFDRGGLDGDPASPGARRRHAQGPRHVRTGGRHRARAPRAHRRARLSQHAHRGGDPEIAKIISVAEVYDTLTASDTYRTRMSSFEALRELRRVAGTQLDGRYVEVLAKLLSGEGVDYRHADAADFDTELGYGTTNQRSANRLNQPVCVNLRRDAPSGWSRAAA